MRKCLAGRLQWCCLDRAGGNARRGAARSDLDSGPGDSARECRTGGVVRRWGGRGGVDTLPNSSKKCFAVLSSVAPRDAHSLCLLCQRRGYSPVALVRSGGLVAMLVQGTKTRFRGFQPPWLWALWQQIGVFCLFLGEPKIGTLDPNNDGGGPGPGPLSLHHVEPRSPPPSSTTSTSHVGI